MEDGAIEIVVEAEAEDYRRVLTERAKTTLKNNKLALGVELTALIIWTINTLIIPDFDGPFHRTVLIALAILFAFHLLAYAGVVYGRHLQIKKWIGAGEPITYRIGPDRIRSSTSLIVWESPWNRFPKIVETETDLLFILANDDLVPIPKRFVLNDAELIGLRNMITSNATGTVELLN